MNHDAKIAAVLELTKGSLASKRRSTPEFGRLTAAERNEATIADALDHLELIEAAIALRDART